MLTNATRRNLATVKRVFNKLNGTDGRTEVEVEMAALHGNTCSGSDQCPAGLPYKNDGGARRKF